MAAELFSTSLPHSGEVEVKKSFIQLNELELPAGNQDQCAGRAEGGPQPDFGSGERDERDGWKDAQPTLRERSASPAPFATWSLNANRTDLLKHVFVFGQKCSHVQQRADV